MKKQKLKKPGFFSKLYLPEKIGFILFIIFFIFPIVVGLIRLIMGDRGDAWGFIELALIFFFITWLNFGMVLIGQGILTFNSYTLLSALFAIISILIQAFTRYV